MSNPLKLPSEIARAGLALLAAYMVILIMLFGFGAWLVLSEREQTVVEARQSLSAHSRTVATHFSHAIGEVDRTLRELSGLIVERGGIELIDPTTLAGYAQARVQPRAQVRSALVVDSMGRVVVETGGLPVAPATQARWVPVLQGLAAEPNPIAVGRPTSHLYPRAIVVPISRYLPVLEGTSGGSLVATIDVGYFLRAYQGFGLPEGSTVAIDHQSGFRLLEYKEPPALAASAGGERITAAQSLPELPLTVVIATPVDAFLAPWRSSSAKTAISIAAAALLIGLVFAWSFGVIVRRTEAESQLRRVNEGLEHRASQDAVALERTSHELSRVSYSISHDLRAPLRAINGFSQALEEDYGKLLDETARDYLRRVRRASMRMGELLDGFTELSHVTRRQITPAEVDLSAMAIEIAARLAASDPMRDVDFDIAHGVRALADPALARHMLNHLFTNAWKFTRDVPRARISFGVFEEGGLPVYFVDDNGVGFDMRYAAKLFAPFNRLHEEEAYSGAGIGLATVKRIVELHGGQIWVEAVPGAGVTVHFTLHRTAAAPPDSADA